LYIPYSPRFCADAEIGRIAEPIIRRRIEVGRLEALAAEVGN